MNLKTNIITGGETETHSARETCFKLHAGLGTGIAFTQAVFVFMFVHVALLF